MLYSECVEVCVCVTARMGGCERSEKRKEKKKKKKGSNRREHPRKKTFRPVNSNLRRRSDKPSSTGRDVSRLRAALTFG